jgi:ABC-type Fe3+-hydroxamate transport system substrate-binding protein
VLSRSIAKIIENQGEILNEVKVIKEKVKSMESRLKDIEEKLENNFDFSNEKTFKEVIFLVLIYLCNLILSYSKIFK